MKWTKKLAAENAVVYLLDEISGKADEGAMVFGVSLAPVDESDVEAARALADAVNEGIDARWHQDELAKEVKAEGDRVRASIVAWCERRATWLTREIERGGKCFEERDQAAFIADAIEAKKDETEGPDPIKGEG